MKITRIELQGYIRFMLNGIQSFTMDVTSPTQIILGTNGSGKSSLLRELTPLPAIPQDFLKGGRKVICIQHQDSEYVLSSVFENGQKHSFLKNERELNDGGTITVQRELVREHFQITSEIQSMLLGDEKLTSMSPARRKEWFVKICETDYTYAIKVFNRLKERLRDTQGAIKLAKKRLVAEMEKQLKPDEEIRLFEEANALHLQLSELMELRKPEEEDLDVLQQQQQQESSGMMKVLQTLKSTLSVLGDDRNYDPTALAEIVQKFDKKIFLVKAFLERDTVQFDKVQKKIDVLQRAEAQTIESLRSDIIRLSAQERELANQSLVTIEPGNAQALDLSFQAVRHQLLELFTEIPNNAERKYTQALLEEAENLQRELQTRISKTTERLTEALTKLKHLETHRDQPNITCVNCNHRFSLEYSPERHANLTKFIADCESLIESKLRPEFAAREQYLASCRQYAQCYRQYVQLSRGNAVLAPYWAYLQEGQYINTRPLEGISALQNIDNDIAIQKQRDDIAKQLIEKNRLLVSLRDVEGGDLCALRDERVDLSRTIDAHMSRLSMLSSRKERYSITLNRIRRLEQLLNSVTEGVSRKIAIADVEVETMRRKILNGTIRQIQSDLASREHLIKQSQQQASVIKNIESQINELTADELVYTELVKIMSPTEGLIAEGLVGFIDAFIGKMNAMIDQVWNYDMVIERCSLGGEAVDLDYRFPFRLPNHPKPVSDVSKGSRGQAEIIDLAFMIVAMGNLGFRDYPLILDEMGAALDAEHRSSLIGLIKQFQEKQMFSQCFMVSHDYNQYSALPNSDICVLCDLNIVLPEKTRYNRHVTMK